MPRHDCYIYGTGRKVLNHNMDSASHKKGGPIFMGEIDPSRHHVNIRSEI